MARKLRMYLNRYEWEQRGKEKALAKTNREKEKKYSKELNTTLNTIYKGE